MFSTRGVAIGHVASLLLAAAAGLAAPGALALGPSIPVVRAEAPPRIDGDLSDAVWQREPVAQGFTRETIPATEPTRAWAAYDAGHLYFAFDCADSQPGSIRGQQKKRNGGFDNDDWVTVGIDPIGDRQTMYWFEVNARGTQGEEIPGGAAAKVQWRGDWQGAAKIGARGWTAELAIPFSILKYPTGQKRFGIVLRRRLNRIGEESSWPQGATYYEHTQEAILTDVAAPAQQVIPRYMPYVLVGAGGNLHNSAGMDVKYTAPNNITGLFTIRPDFQTIEDVIQTVDFSYNPRYLEDRRPFFTEGGGSFNDGMMFYSRRIGEIDAGLKSFGKLGKTSFGLMQTTRFSGDTNYLTTLKYDTSLFSDVGLGIVDHNGDRNNVAYKVSANWRRPAKVNGYYWGVSSYLNTGGGPHDRADTAYVDRYGGSGIPGWHLSYDRVGKNYDPALAFVNDRDRQSYFASADYGKTLPAGKVLN